MSEEKKKNNPYLVVFKKPYLYEEKEYTEVDLSGIEDLTVNDLADADKKFISSGQIATVNEMSVGYAAIIAATVTKKPVEFFNGLPAGEGIKIKNLVTSFFYE
jgi:hypothetical protein